MVILQIIIANNEKIKIINLAEKIGWNIYLFSSSLPSSIHLLILSSEQPLVKTASSLGFSFKRSSILFTPSSANLLAVACPNPVNFMSGVLPSSVLAAAFDFAVFTFAAFAFGASFFGASFLGVGAFLFTFGLGFFLILCS